MSHVLQFQDDRLVSTLSPMERTVLANVEVSLAEGRELYRWWRRTEADNEIFRAPLVQQLNSPDWNYSFFSEAPLRRGLLPVLGVIQGMFYDQPKVPASHERRAVDFYRAQMQEFALRYFLRTSVQPLPQFTPSNLRSEAKGSQPAFHGWSFQQVFYKLRETGTIGRFPSEERFRIVDMRRLFDTYEWILMQVRLFSFTLDKTFLWANGPRVSVPVPQTVWIVAHRDLCSNVENPERGVLGRYGGGWAVVSVPEPGSFLAYGPEHLGTTFEFIHFHVLEDGQIWAKVAFVSSRPNRVFNVDLLRWILKWTEKASFGALALMTRPLRRWLAAAGRPLAIDPLQMFMNYLESMTGGMSKRELCISTSQLHHEIMVAHFVSLFQFILQTLPTWEQIPNWLDRENLPEWVDGFRPELEPINPTSNPATSGWGPMPTPKRTAQGHGPREAVMKYATRAQTRCLWSTESH